MRYKKKLTEIVPVKTPPAVPQEISPKLEKALVQIAGALNKDAPIPVITVKTPEITIPGPAKKWEFTGKKTGDTWKLIAERIE